jgi:argininosuccinate synthase
MVYHGEWFHPLKEDLDAFIEKSQEVVSGRMRIKLYKGNVDIVSRESETKLFFPEIRSIKSASFDQRMCRDAAQIRGLPFEILAKRMGRR